MTRSRGDIPHVMHSARRFDARLGREGPAPARGGPNEAGFIPYAYRPFDNRWLYWEADTKLLDEKRADYKPHVFNGNLWLVTLSKSVSREWSPPQVISTHLGVSTSWNEAHLAFLPGSGTTAWDLKGMEPNAVPTCHPPPNATSKTLGWVWRTCSHHVLAVLHDPAYREANAGVLRMEWPRIPLPGWPEGDSPGAAEELAASAERGRELARLLDSETPVPGVTTGTLRPEIASIGVPATVDGHNMSGEDFSVTAGWGHFGTGDAVMPGQGTGRTAALHRPRTRCPGRSAGSPWRFHR